MIKRIRKDADGSIDFEENYEYDENGNKIKRIKKNADGLFSTEYDEKGNKIKEKFKRSEGISQEDEYDENQEVIKSKKSYYDDKPVIEGKFDNEGELIKKDVENQQDKDKETSYTGQVNSYNNQKHGSGKTTFKNNTTEGGYYENGELLFGGQKNYQDFSQKRGKVSLREEYKIDENKNKYQLRTTESRGNKITLRDDPSGYTFTTRSGKQLILPKSLGRKKALNAANMINAAVGIVKQSGFELDEFEAGITGDLQADYKLTSSNLKYGLKDVTLIANVAGKFGISASDLVAWLNEYRKDVGI